LGACTMVTPLLRAARIIALSFGAMAATLWVALSHQCLSHMSQMMIAVSEAFHFCVSDCSSCVWLVCLRVCSNSISSPLTVCAPWVGCACWQALRESNNRTIEVNDLKEDMAFLR